MNKKIIVGLLVFMNLIIYPCFAVDRKDLNVEFFNRFNDE